MNVPATSSLAAFHLITEAEALFHWRLSYAPCVPRDSSSLRLCHSNLWPAVNARNQARAYRHAKLGGLSDAGCPQVLVDRRATMSHFLAVNGQDHRLKRIAFQNGLRIFKRVHKLSPIKEIDTVATKLALFPCLLSRTPKVVRSSTGYMCGVGTWFYQGASGEEALRRLATDTLSLRNAKLEHLCDIDGWFAVASLQEDGDITLVTDRLGEFHVYMVRMGECIIISTSSLVLGALSDASWDSMGCRQFLEMGVIFEPSRTLLKNVEKMAPASFCTIVNGRTQSRNYWSMKSVLEKRANRPSNVLELASALTKAVTTIMTNFSRPVFDLTGGFDTRGILGAVIQSGNVPDFVVNGCDSDIDVVISTRIAAEFGLKHRRAWSDFQSAAEWWDCAKRSLVLVDGEQDVLFYAPTFQVQNRLAREFDATVNGGVGEICQGHWWELCFPFLGSRVSLDARLLASRRLAAEDEIPGLLAFRDPINPVEYLTEAVRQQNAGLENYPKVAHVDSLYLAFWEQRFYGRIVSATSHLWPVISPYGFGGPLEAALSVPWQDRVWRRLSRRLINYQNANLAALPTANGGPAAPLRFSNALSFLPLAHQYKTLVFNRLAKNFHLKKNGNACTWTDHDKAARIDELCKLDEVRELTDPRKMVTAHFYNPRQLQKTLADRPYRPNAPTAWPGRVLTLELLGRELRDARTGVHSFDGDFVAGTDSSR